MARRRRDFDKSTDAENIEGILATTLGVVVVFMLPFLLFESSIRPYLIVLIVILVMALTFLLVRKTTKK